MDFDQKKRRVLLVFCSYHANTFSIQLPTHQDHHRRYLPCCLAKIDPRNFKYNTSNFELRVAGLYPEGSPSRNSRWPRQNLGQRGGLEIVFNQQLTRLG